jgi:hypothetical protein
MRLLLAALVAAGTSCIASSAVGVTTYESSRSFGRIFSSPFRAVSNKSNVTTGAGFGRIYPNFAQIQTGLTAATDRVDVDDDMGAVTNFQVRPYALTGASATSSFNTTTQIWDPAITFPDPPRRITAGGTWTETLTLTSITGGTPTFPSSTVDELRPLTTSLYQMINNLQYEGLEFTVHGTYQMVGPLTTVTAPFSLEYVPRGQQSAFAVPNIPASATFGDQFPYFFQSAAASYDPSTGTRIFSGNVDGVNISVDLELNSVSYAQIPEPSTGCLALGALIVFRRGSTFLVRRRVN